jgi:hypothetical protein
MANPYGIEQVDVPGILSAFTTARTQRTQQLLTERAMAREDAQLERENRLRTAYAKLRLPGADGGMSSAVSAYGVKDAPATAPAGPVAPADFGQSLGGPGAVATAASPVAPAAPATPTDATPHPLQGWLDTNQGAIQDIMQQDPQSGLQLLQHFHQLDAEKQQAVKDHLVFADQVNQTGLKLLFGVHDQASWDVARQNYGAFLKQYNLPAPNLPDTFDPKTVQGLLEQGQSVQEHLNAMKPVVLGEGAKLVNPVSGATVAENEKADLQHFAVNNADGTTTPFAFNPKTGATYQLRDGGMVQVGAGPAGAGGATSPKAAAVASTLTTAGLPAAVVAGFMGNFHVEGGYDGAKGDGGSASGIGQWHADRATNFRQVIGKDVTAATPAEQAQFVAWEMQHPTAAGMTVAQRDQILAAKTPGEAAALIDKFYERSSGRDRQARIAAATAFAGGGSASASPAGAGTPITGKSSGTLTDDAARLAAAIYKTKGTLPAGIARTKLDVDKILNVAANMSMEDAHRFADQTVNTWQDTHTAGQTLTAFAKGPEARQTRSLSVAIEHMQLYKEAALALQNGNVPAFNSLSQLIAKATGQPAPTNAQALHGLVMDEVVKGVVGASGGVQDRDKAAAILKQNSSPAQFAGGFDQINGLLLGQLHSLNQQYKAGTGRDDFERFLTPAGARVFKDYQTRHGLGGAAATPSMGEVRRGYRFKGGNPGSPSSWEKV